VFVPQRGGGSGCGYLRMTERLEKNSMRLYSRGTSVRKLKNIFGRGV
jgi:hypothetical protein